MQTLRAGDIGVTIEVQVLSNGGIVNLVGATTKELIFIAPSGARTTKTAAFTTTGIDGKIQYVSQAGDFEELGNWGVQAHVILPSSEHRSSIDTFNVQPSI